MTEKANLIAATMATALLLSGCAAHTHPDAKPAHGKAKPGIIAEAKRIPTANGVGRQVATASFALETSW